MNPLKRVLCLMALILGVSFAQNASAQSTYSGCGTLIDQVFGGCVELFQPLGTSEVYQLSGLGSPGYVTGDVLFLEGNLSLLCPTFCAITGCLEVTAIGDCGVPFSDCGELIQGTTCSLLETATGDQYEIDSLGTFQVGDFVQVDGLLDVACGSLCGTAGCISDAVLEACVVDYVRGDTNDDGNVDVADAVTLLGQLFVPGTPPATCEAAGDTNDGSGVDISDAIYLLSFLFVAGSPPPAAPFPDCGPTVPGGLSCVLFTSCP